MERQATDWKKISVNHLSEKGIISRIYKEFLIVKKKSPIRERPKVKKDFTEENKEMANKYMHVSTLAINEMQIKTKIRYLYTAIRIIKIKSNENSKCW